MELRYLFSTHLSDNALCLYQVLLISKGFGVMDLDSRVDARVVANVDGRMYERTETVSLYSAMPEAGTTEM